MFIVAYPLMLFIAIPERIFIEMGFHTNPEKISIFIFLLVWILIFGVIYLSIKILKKILKHTISYFKH